MFPLSQGWASTLRASLEQPLSLDRVHFVEVAWLTLAGDPVHPVKLVHVLRDEGAPEGDAGQVKALDLDVMGFCHGQDPKDRP